MRLPDPFTPNLKVDMLPEIAHAPRVLTNFSSMIQPPNFKKVSCHLFSCHLHPFMLNCAINFFWICVIGSRFLLESTCTCDFPFWASWKCSDFKRAWNGIQYSSDECVGSVCRHSGHQLHSQQESHPQHDYYCSFSSHGYLPKSCCRSWYRRFVLFCELSA